MAKVNRSAVMKTANRLVKQGMPRSEATKQAWAMHRNGGNTSIATKAPKQQPGGIKAAARRYGVNVNIDGDRLAKQARMTAERAKELAERAAKVVKQVALEAIKRTATPALPYHGATIEMKRDEKGVYHM